MTLSIHIAVPNACIFLSSLPNQLKEVVFFKRKKKQIFELSMRKIKYFYCKNFRKILRKLPKGKREKIPTLGCHPEKDLMSDKNTSRGLG